MCEKQKLRKSQERNIRKKQPNISELKNTITKTKTQWIGLTDE